MGSGVDLLGDRVGSVGRHRVGSVAVRGRFVRRHRVGSVEVRGRFVAFVTLVKLKLYFLYDSRVFNFLFVFP